MAAAPLNAPTNRLLGWSINDFSLYGAQPAVTIGLGAATPLPSPFLRIPATPEARVASPTAGDGGDAAAIVPATADLTPGDFTPVVPAMPSAPAVTMPQAPSVAAPPTLDPQVPSPTGSGSMAPVQQMLAVGMNHAGEAAPATGVLTLTAPVLDLAAPVSVPASALAPALDIAAPLVASTLTGTVFAVGLPAVDGVAHASLAGLDAATAGTQSLLGDAVGELGGTGEQLVQSVAPAASALDHVVDQVDATAASLTASTAELAEGAGAPLMEAATSEVHAASDAVGVTAAPLVGTVDQAVAPVAEAAGSTAQATGDTVAAVAAPVTDAPGAVVDGIGALTQQAGEAVVAPLVAGAGTAIDESSIHGADPAGGIATLVDMVATSDPFALNDAGHTAAPAADAGSIVDTLADEAGGSSLLGVADHHGTPADHHDDHLPELP